MPGFEDPQVVDTETEPDDDGDWLFEEEEGEELTAAQSQVQRRLRWWGGGGGASALPVREDDLAKKIAETTQLKPVSQCLDSGCQQWW